MVTNYGTFYVIFAFHSSRPLYLNICLVVATSRVKTIANSVLIRIVLFTKSVSLDLGHLPMGVNTSAEGKGVFSLE